MEYNATSYTRSGAQGRAPGSSQSGPGAPGGRDQLLSSSVVRYVRGEFRQSIDAVALEVPLEILLNGRRTVTTMRTPGADIDLALGQLLTSGLVPHYVQFEFLDFQETDEAIQVHCPVAGRFPAPEPGARQAMETPMAELAAKLLAMRATLEERQRLHRHTGATHCAMFFDQDCAPVSFGEDVGRHNAFDKCVGDAVRRAALARARHAVITSRLSHEIVSKAVRTGISVLAGFSVATSNAVDMAREHGMVLVGRLRDETMVIYE